MSTKEEKKLLFSISLLYGIASIALVGYPLWFKEPGLLCKGDGVWKECSELTACASEEYMIDEKNSIFSLVADFKMVCEKGRTVRRRVISIGLSGYFLGLFFNSFLVDIEAHGRKKYIAKTGLLFSAAAFSSVYFFSSNVYLVGVCISIMSMCYGIIFANCINFIYEAFEPKFSEVAYIIMSLFWGIFGVIFPSLSLISSTNWKILNLFCAVCAASTGYWMLDLKESIRDIPFQDQTVALFYSTKKIF